jgi:hypothetical protein
MNGINPREQILATTFKASVGEKRYITIHVIGLTIVAIMDAEMRVLMRIVVMPCFDDLG